MKQVKPHAFTKTEKSWTMYDFANSVYATIVMAAVLPIYFTGVAGAAGKQGDVLWGIGTSIATMTAAILAPILGALGDYKGNKKKFFLIFASIGIAFTAFMALSNDYMTLLAGYVVSYIGFTLGNMFYDAFLTDVTTPDRMDEVSGRGFAMGYIGGSTIPFVVSIALITFADKIGISNVMAVKISLWMTAAWWAVFSIPFVRDVRQKYYTEPDGRNPITAIAGNIARTAREIAHNRGLLWFMIAYFFYIDGVATVIHMATAYGAALNLGTTGMILALLVTQIVAVPFSILFAKLAKKFGATKVISAAIAVYIAICVVGFFMGYTVEQADRQFAPGDTAHAAAMTRATALFWLLAVMVGTCQGGIQALSRSHFGKMVPAEKSNEYFGFFEIFGKFSAVIGPAMYAGVAALTGRSSLGVISLTVLFVLGLIFMMISRRHSKAANEPKTEKVV